MGATKQDATVRDFTVKETGYLLSILKALLAVLILVFKENSNNHDKTLEYKLVVILKV